MRSLILLRETTCKCLRINLVLCDFYQFKLFNNLFYISTKKKLSTTKLKRRENDKKRQKTLNELNNKRKKSVFSIFRNFEKILRSTKSISQLYIVKKNRIKTN